MLVCVVVLWFCGVVLSRYVKVKYGGKIRGKEMQAREYIVYSIEYQLSWCTYTIEGFRSLSLASLCCLISLLLSFLENASLTESSLARLATLEGL